MGLVKQLIGQEEHDTRGGERKQGRHCRPRAKSSARRRSSQIEGTKPPFCHVLGPGLTGGQNGFTSFRRVEAKLLL